MPPKQTQNTPVRAVDRSMQILEGLRELGGGTLSEVADEVDIPKSTIHNHLVTLEQKQYIVKEENEYHLGLRFLDFGEFVKRRKSVYVEAKPLIEELANKTGERAQFIAEEHDHGVFVHVAKGDRAVKSGTSLGERAGPRLHATAAGKVLLAFLPDERRDTILDRWGMRQITENTVQDRDELLEELSEIRERRYAINREEHIEGLCAAGVPVMGCDDCIVGAISVSGPTHRMGEERLHSELPETLLGVSNELELNITFSESQS